jgi:ubiquinone/menaquinone biosynthesis C-methylase UbiE
VPKVDEWTKRYSVYNNLRWTGNNQLLERIRDTCNLQKDHIVCDVGTGTGIVANYISNYCSRVDGIDISSDMLKIAKEKNDRKNVKFHLMNAEDINFPNCIYDRVIARMSFHHIMNTKKAVCECHRILKDNGKIIICEVIPPKDSVSFYEKFFRIKEKRHIFIREDLLELLNDGEFKKIEYKNFIMENVSIKNWLKNSGLSEQKQKTIFDMWFNTDDIVKKEHNLSINNGDIFVDWNFMIFSGIKSKNS